MRELYLTIILNGQPEKTREFNGSLLQKLFSKLSKK
jgi:hypothetical protein